MLPAGDSRMEWTLRLVGMGIDGQSRSLEVMTISRPDGLGDIANLGITLYEAKQLLVQVQQQVVADQATIHATFRPDCRSCGGTCHVKDWQPHRFNRIVIEGTNGIFDVYIARPTAPTAPAVVVLQELFGVNADIRATCDELATEGFIAIAPDRRQEPGVDLDVTVIGSPS